MLPMKTTMFLVSITFPHVPRFDITQVGQIVKEKERNMVEGRTIGDDHIHLFNHCFKSLPSGHRYQAMLCKLYGSRSSFI